MVPIDFSVCSKKALQYAVSLAQDYRASVVLIHVVEGRSTNGSLLGNRERELETLARQETRRQVPVTTLVKVGEPLREIINVAKAGLVDLLLISTHARAGLPDFCLGSAAEQIVRYAPCPCWSFANRSVTVCASGGRRATHNRGRRSGAGSEPPGGEQRIIQP